MRYAICEISGRQYKISPGQIVEVDKLSAEKTLSVDKVLLIADGEEIKLGMPYLEDVLNFEVLENIKKPKVRVATYHAKANYRRVKGQRKEASRIRLVSEEGKVKPAKTVKKS